MSSKVWWIGAQSVSSMEWMFWIQCLSVIRFKHLMASLLIILLWKRSRVVTSKARSLDIQHQQLCEARDSVTKSFNQPVSILALEVICHMTMPCLTIWETSATHLRVKENRCSTSTKLQDSQTRANLVSTPRQHQFWRLILVSIISSRLQLMKSKLLRKVQTTLAHC